MTAEWGDWKRGKWTSGLDAAVRPVAEIRYVPNRKYMSKGQSKLWPRATLSVWEVSGRGSSDQLVFKMSFDVKNSSATHWRAENGIPGSLLGDLIELLHSAQDAIALRAKSAKVKQ